MKTETWSRLQANFFTGLAVVLPAVVSIAVVVWLFGTISTFTDKLLFGIPGEWKYVDGVSGAIRWYWSVAALLITLALITGIGRLARHYVGKKLIAGSEGLLMRVPLLNKIYSTVKQVKEAFAGNKSSFQEAVLVQFPTVGHYSLGFITGQQRGELQARSAEPVVSVFIPTTPNPTSGFLLFVPRAEVIPLQMSVADAIKSIISLGAVTPPHPAAPRRAPPE